MLLTPDQIQVLSRVAKRLCSATSPAQRRKILIDHIEKNQGVEVSVDLDETHLAMIAIGHQAQISQLDSRHLSAIDRFYSALGGIVGYHVKALKLGKDKQRRSVEQFSAITPETIDEEAAVRAGIMALRHCCEIYPVGGLGSRLDLRDDKGQGLPVAYLPFLGRSLLEGLIRDVEAKEQLYEKHTGQRLTLPLVLMCSAQNDNESYIRKLLEENRWFNRPKTHFLLLSQLSVPVIDPMGVWTGDFAPGGHGALWKTLLEAQAFDWLAEHEVRYALVRQINNPLAGLDSTQLTLLGWGALQKKSFGVVCCKRVPGAAEGVWVCAKKRQQQTLVNIEYCEIDAYKLSDDVAKYSNTNVLFVDLEKVRPYIKSHPHPGLIMNRKGGSEGRLESMMQNISESCPSTESFAVLAPRSKVISVTKRRFSGQKSETPEGAAYDWLENSYYLLKNHCLAKVPAWKSFKAFCASGAALTFIYHPALGPRYCDIAKKIRDAKFEDGSEFELEISDIDIENLHLEGSLIIEGKPGSCCQLNNVRVVNRGIDTDATELYWKRDVKRHQMCHITLEEGASLVLKDVTLRGDVRLHLAPKESRFVSDSACRSA